MERSHIYACIRCIMIHLVSNTIKTAFLGSVAIRLHAKHWYDLTDNNTGFKGCRTNN